MGRIKRYWGTQRVARACQVSPATVAHWIDQGLLSGHKTPTGRRRVEVHELVDFLRAHDMAVPANLYEAMDRVVMVLVDDDVAYLEAMTRLIEQADLGVDVVKVTNGVDALIAIGRVRPALIALDFRLPDLNALQVIERLLEPGRRLHAEVLVITGGIELKEQEELHKLGVETIVNKAEGVTAVIDAIRQALRRRKAA